MRFRENTRGFAVFWWGEGADFGNKIVDPVRRHPYMKY
jgi:hypothetical protein